MADVYVYSTLSCDTGYATYKKGGGDLPIVEHIVFIKGGAGVANDRFITPLGVATGVSNEEAELLEQNEVFRLHRENGFITMQKKQVDVEKVVADMVGRDVSAPIVPEDFSEKSKAKPHSSSQRKGD